MKRTTGFLLVLMLLANVSFAGEVEERAHNVLMMGTGVGIAGLGFLLVKDKDIQPVIPIVALGVCIIGDVVLSATNADCAFQTFGIIGVSVLSIKF